MKEKILILANDVAAASFMDYPDYDSDHPITELAEALTVLVLNSADHDTNIEAEELYDFLNLKIANHI